MAAPVSPADAAVPGGLRVRAYAPGDEEALVAIFCATFHHRSLDEWHWLFAARDGGPSEVDIRVLTTDDDRIVGSVSHVRADAWVGGRRLRLAIGADMMILPEFRGHGGAEALVKAFRATDHGFDMNFGVVNAGSRHVTRRYMGTSVLRFVPIWTHVNAHGSGRHPRLGAAAALPERALISALTHPLPRLEVVDLETLGADVDQLAADSATFAPCIRVRDARYLRWHWLQDPRTRWHVRAVRDERGGLRGIAVSGVKGDGSARTGVITDLLVRDTTALRALVLDASRRLSRDGCLRVTCAYRDPRAWAHVAMLRAGFRPTLRPGPRVACGPLSARAAETLAGHDSWYLTGADIDL